MFCTSANVHSVKLVMYSNCFSIICGYGHWKLKTVCQVTVLTILIFNLKKKKLRQILQKANQC